MIIYGNWFILVLPTVTIIYQPSFTIINHLHCCGINRVRHGQAGFAKAWDVKQAVFSPPRGDKTWELNGGI